MRDRCMWLTSTVVEDHAMTLTSTPSNHQTPLFLPSFNPHSTRPGLRPQRHSPHLSLFAHCVVATLSAASLTQLHKKSLSCKKEREEKRDYDTWCSQVVSNPSTNQARRGLTSLIRREVVLSSWYGRNSFFRLRFVDFWQ